MHQRERGEQESDAKLFQVLTGNLSSFNKEGQERERDGKEKKEKNILGLG